MNELNALLAAIQQHGWPVFLLAAIWSGIIYVKPHVDLILADKQRLIDLVTSYEAIAKAALTRAEEANALTNRVLQGQIANDVKVDKIQSSVNEVKMELAKLSGKWS